MEALAERFRSLWQPVAPALLAWANLHVRAPLRAQLDPEDLVQEVVCRAYEGFSDFTGGALEFRSWLFGIARNVLFKALRRLGTGSGRARFDTDRWSRVPDGATSITRRVARADLLREFLERAELLEESERNLLLWRGLEELPLARVAELLGVSADVAAKRWQRLRGRLRSGGGPFEFLAS